MYFYIMRSEIVTVLRQDEVVTSIIENIQTMLKVEKDLEISTDYIKDVINSQFTLIPEAMALGADYRLHKLGKFYTAKGQLKKIKTAKAKDRQFNKVFTPLYVISDDINEVTDNELRQPSYDL